MSQGVQDNLRKCLYACDGFLDIKAPKTTSEVRERLEFSNEESVDAPQAVRPRTWFGFLGAAS